MQWIVNGVSPSPSMISPTTHPFSAAGGLETSPSRVHMGGNKWGRDQVEGLVEEGQCEGRKKAEVKGRSQSMKGGGKTTSKVRGKGSRTGRNVLYCTTAALDRYVTLLDRTPCTWMMTSLNIGRMAFYDHWHPHLHPSLFYLCPSILLPSNCFCPS